MEGAVTFVALPKLATALELVPAGTKLHLHFEKLTYFDHACLDLIHNWRSQYQQAGNTVVMG